MRETRSYGYGVVPGPTDDTVRITGYLAVADGNYHFDLIRPRSVDPADVVTEISTFTTAAAGFKAVLQDYLDDLAPAWGDEGGRILTSRGYALNLYTWVLEVQLKLADGQLETLYQYATDYNQWPSVATIHAAVEDRIGAFPSSAPVADIPWVPADEDDFGGALTEEDQIAQALMQHFEPGATSDYSSVCPFPEYTARALTRATTWHPAPSPTVDFVNFVP